MSRRRKRQWTDLTVTDQFCCPACRLEVRPFYFAALNAIDLSIAGERIGDRPRPLKTRTLERIEYGRQKFGRTALVIRTNMTTDHGRVSIEVGQ